MFSMLAASNQKISTSSRNRVVAKKFIEAKQRYDAALVKNPLKKEDFEGIIELILEGMKNDYTELQVAPLLSEVYGEDFHQTILLMLRDCMAKAQGQLKKENLDIQAIKNQAEEFYKNGKFKEALAQYELLIYQDPSEDFYVLEQYYLRHSECVMESTHQLSDLKVGIRPEYWKEVGFFIVAWWLVAKTELAQEECKEAENLPVMRLEFKRDFELMRELYGTLIGGRLNRDIFTNIDKFHRNLQRQACVKVIDAQTEEKILEEVNQKFGEKLWRIARSPIIKALYGEGVRKGLEKRAAKYSPRELDTTDLINAITIEETKNEFTVGLVSKEVEDSLKKYNPGEHLQQQAAAVFESLRPTISQLSDLKQTFTPAQLKEFQTSFQTTRARFPNIKFSLQLLCLEADLYQRCEEFDRAQECLYEGIHSATDLFGLPEPGSKDHSRLIAAIYQSGFCYYEKGLKNKATRKADFAQAKNELTNACHMNSKFKMKTHAAKALKALGQCETEQHTPDRVVTSGELEKERREAHKALEEKKYDEALRLYNNSIQLVARHSDGSMCHFQQRAMAQLSAPSSGPLTNDKYDQFIKELDIAIWIYHANLDSTSSVNRYLEVLVQKISVAIMGMQIDVSKTKDFDLFVAEFLTALQERIDEVINDDKSDRKEKVAKIRNMQRETYNTLRAMAKKCELNQGVKTAEYLFDIANMIKNISTKEIEPLETQPNEQRIINLHVKPVVPEVKKVKEEKFSNQSETMPDVTYGSHFTRRPQSVDEIKRKRDAIKKTLRKMDEEKEAERQAAIAEAKQKADRLEAQRQADREASAQRRAAKALLANQKLTQTKDEFETNEEKLPVKRKSTFSQADSIDDLLRKLSGRDPIQNAQLNTGKTKPKKPKHSILRARLQGCAIGSNVILTPFETKIMQAFGQIAMYGGQSLDRTLEEKNKLKPGELLREDADHDFQSGFTLQELAKIAQEKLGEDLLELREIKDKNLLRLVIQDGKEKKYVDIVHNPYLQGSEPNFLKAILECDTTISAIFITPDGKLHAHPQSLEDLRKGVVRMIELPRVSFKQDSLRILRVLNKVATLQQSLMATRGIKFILADNQENPEENIPPAIKECAQELTKLSPSSVNIKLKDLFFHVNHEKTIQDLLAYDVFDTLFPDFSRLFTGIENLFAEKNLYQRFCAFIAEVKSRNTSLSMVYDFLLNEVNTEDREAIIQRTPLMQQQYDFVAAQFAEEPLSILTEIQRVAEFGLPLQQRVLLAMQQQAPKLKEQSPQEINKLLRRIISGKYVEQGIDYLLQSGVMAQLFPAELLDILQKTHGNIATGLAKMVHSLKGAKVRPLLTGFYQELVAMMPALETHLLVKQQFDYPKIKYQEKFVAEFNKLLESKANDKAKNDWLDTKCQYGQAELAFTTLLENGFLSKLFPNIHQSLIKKSTELSKSQLKIMLQKVDAKFKNKNRNNTLNLAYTNFLVWASQGDTNQIKQWIDQEPILRTYFFCNPFSQEILSEALRNYPRAKPVLLQTVPVPAVKASHPPQRLSAPQSQIGFRSQTLSAPAVQASHHTQRLPAAQSQTGIRPQTFAAPPAPAGRSPQKLFAAPPAQAQAQAGRLPAQTFSAPLAQAARSPQILSAPAAQTDPRQRLSALPVQTASRPQQTLSVLSPGVPMLSQTVYLPVQGVPGYPQTLFIPVQTVPHFFVLPQAAAPVPQPVSVPPPQSSPQPNNLFTQSVTPRQAEVRATVPHSSEQLQPSQVSVVIR